MVSHTFNLKQGQADRCELEDSQNCYTKTPYLKKQRTLKQTISLNLMLSKTEMCAL